MVSRLASSRPRPRHVGMHLPPLARRQIGAQADVLLLGPRQLLGRQRRRERRQGEPCSRHRPGDLHGTAAPLQQLLADRQRALRRGAQPLHAPRRTPAARSGPAAATAGCSDCSGVRRSWASPASCTQSGSGGAMRSVPNTPITSPWASDSGAACQVKCQTRPSSSARTNTASRADRSRQARSSGRSPEVTASPPGVLSGRLARSALVNGTPSRGQLAGRVVEAVQHAAAHVEVDVGHARGRRRLAGPGGAVAPDVRGHGRLRSAEAGRSSPAHAFGADHHTSMSRGTPADTTRPGRVG